MQIYRFSIHSKTQFKKLFLSGHPTLSFVFLKCFSTFQTFPIHPYKLKLKRLLANGSKLEDLRFFSLSPSFSSPLAYTPFLNFSRFYSSGSFCIDPSSSDSWYPYFNDIVNDSRFSTHDKFILLGKLSNSFPLLPSFNEVHSWKTSVNSNPFDPSSWLTKITVADIYAPFCNQNLSTSFLTLFCKLSIMDSDWSLLHQFLNLIYPTSYSLSSSSSSTSSLSFFHDAFALLVQNAPDLALEWFHFLLTEIPLNDPRIYSLLATLCHKVNNKTSTLIIPLETYVLNHPALYPYVIPSIAETWIRLFHWDHAIQLLQRYTCLETNVQAKKTYLIYLDFSNASLSNLIDFVLHSNDLLEVMDFVIRVLLKTPSMYQKSLFLYLDLLDFEYVSFSMETLLQILSKAPMVPGFPCDHLLFTLHLKKKVPFPPSLAIAWLRYICASDTSFLPTFFKTMQAQRWYFHSQDAWKAFKLLKFYHRPAMEFFWLLNLIHPSPPFQFVETCLKKIIALKDFQLTQLYLPYVNLTKELTHAMLTFFPPLQSLPLLLSSISSSCSSSSFSTLLTTNEDVVSTLLTWTALKAPALFLGLLQSPSLPITEAHFSACISAFAKLNRLEDVDFLLHSAPHPLPLSLRLTTIQAYCQLRQPAKAFLLLSSLPMDQCPDLWLAYFKCLIFTHRWNEFQSMLTKQTLTVFETQPPQQYLAFLHLIMRMWIETHQEHHILQVVPHLPYWVPETLVLFFMAYQQHLAQPHWNSHFLETVFQYFKTAIHQGLFKPMHWKTLVPLLIQFHRWQDLTQLLTLVPSSFPNLFQSPTLVPSNPRVQGSPPYEIKLFIHSKVEARLTYLNKKSSSTFLSSTFSSSSSSFSSTSSSSSSSSSASINTQSEIRSMKRLVQVMERVTWKR